MHIKITEKMHQELKNHLHCGDGLEALAFAICGRLNLRDDDFLLVHELFLVPYNSCDRTEYTVSWKTLDVEHLIEECLKKGFGLVKFHSHFVKDSDFSDLDDQSDITFFDSVYAWIDNDLPHASVVMYPDGSMKGRVVKEDLNFALIDKFSIIGEDIRLYSNSDKITDVPRAFKRNLQTFGLKTVNILKNMKVGVVGCSGTGSPLIQMLHRLGVGELVIIDAKRVGYENLNRIVTSSLSDVTDERLKVDVIKDHIEKVNIGTKVITFSCLIQESREAIDEFATCDFIFGCMDSVEGRHYINLISTYYLVPAIDIGVKLVADGTGGIDSIIGNIHYLYPNSKTLLERGVYNSQALASESLKRISKEEFENRQAYFENAEVESPAVISVNSTCSSIALNEMLSRIHPYRNNDNFKHSHTVINLTEWDLSSYQVESTSDSLHSQNIGVGNLEPSITIYET